MRNLRNKCLLLVAVLSISPGVIFSQDNPPLPAGGNAPVSPAPAEVHNHAGDRKDRREKLRERRAERRQRREKRREDGRRRREERREKRREMRRKHSGGQAPVAPQAPTPANP